jgi:hypothetical protein
MNPRYPLDSEAVPDDANLRSARSCQRIGAVRPAIRTPDGRGADGQRDADPPCAQGAADRSSRPRTPPAIKLGGARAQAGEYLDKLD